MKVVAALVCAIFFFCLIPLNDAQITASNRGSLSIASMLNELNLIRKDAGLRPFVISEKLNSSAQYKSDDLILKDYYAHVSPSGVGLADLLKQSSYSYRQAAENAVFHEFSAKDVVDSWMNSPGHRKNILNPIYLELGVGITEGHFIDGLFTTMVTTHYGAPLDIESVITLPEPEPFEYPQIALIKTKANSLASN